MNTCERCKFPVQWRMSVRPVGSTKMVKVCEDCAEVIQAERDEDNREPRDADGEDFRGGEAAAYERESQAEIQRTLK